MKQKLLITQSASKFPITKTKDSLHVSQQPPAVHPMPVES